MVEMKLCVLLVSAVAWIQAQCHVGSIAKTVFEKTFKHFTLYTTKYKHMDVSLGLSRSQQVKT